MSGYALHPDAFTDLDEIGSTSRKTTSTPLTGSFPTSTPSSARSLPHRTSDIHDDAPDGVHPRGWRERPIWLPGRGHASREGHPHAAGRRRRSVAMLQQVSGRSRQDLRDFAYALERSATSSIDLFLEGRVDRPDYLDLGKAVIAATLIPCEQEDRLFQPVPEDIVPAVERLYHQRWYRYAMNRLGATPQFPAIDFAVLTFNYDRSFEHFMLVVLQYRYGVDRATALALMESIPVIHLHGDLGDLAEHVDQKNLARPYMPSLSPTTIGIASKRIRIVHEKIDEEPQFAAAKKLLATANNIWFLGFGYLPRNMERLGKENFTRFGQPTIVHLKGTGYGLLDAERHAAERTVGNSQFFDLGGPDEDVLTFLRKTWIT